MKVFCSVIIFFISLNSICQTKKLPIPSKLFLTEVKFKDEGDLRYFEIYFGKPTKKVLKRFQESKEICSVVYSFSNNVIYKSNKCSEAGLENEILFVGYGKDEIIKFVEWFFKTEDNKWNKSKTIYQPKVNDAGCYLKILEAKNQIVLKYYCGC